MAAHNMTKKEKEPIFSGDIGYTEGDIVSGLEWSRSELAGFKQDVKSSNDLTRDIARQSIPQYESAIQFGNQHSPIEMVTELQTIFNRAHTLEVSGKEQLEIGRIMGEEFGDQISHYRVLLRQEKGWIKSLGQWVYAAALK